MYSVVANSVTANNINFWDLVESLKRKLDCQLNLMSANLGDEINKLDLFVADGQSINNKFIAENIECFMQKAGLIKVDEGDFCGRESHGCMEFEDKEKNTYIVLFTNDTKVSGRLYINCNKY